MAPARLKAYRELMPMIGNRLWIQEFVRLSSVRLKYGSDKLVGESGELTI